MRRRLPWRFDAELTENTALKHLIALASVAAAATLAIAAPAHAGAPRDIVARSADGSSVRVDHSAWDKLLKAHVKPGNDGLNRVDYASFKKLGQEALKTYLLTLVRVDPARLDRKEQFAYLANLYNAKTIDIVLDHYPVRSIKDISLGGGLFAAFTGGPWKAKVVSVAGVSLSLDDIEHDILRKVFKDPRVHYAVNCASIGCPNLQAEAFTAGRLDAQLDAAARAYVNHPRGVAVRDARRLVDLRLVQGGLRRQRCGRTAPPSGLRGAGARRKDQVDWRHL